MKKTISIILILIMLLLPFGVLVNVKAEGITITTDANGKVTNNTGTITVKDVNTERGANGYVNENSDTFKAYKVVDIYYDSQTKEISYRFTNDFQSFLNDSAYASDNTVHGLTIDDYLALTSDYYGSDSENWNAVNGSIGTSSTLNVLVSKYATFIRKKANTASPITGLAMTNGNYTQSDNQSSARLSNVVPGSYLILPDSVLIRESTDGGMSRFENYIYGVMVANVFFKANNDGWILNDAEIYAKRDNSGVQIVFFPMSIDEYQTIDWENMQEEEAEEFFSKAGYTQGFNSGGKKFLYVYSLDTMLPTNANASINSDVQAMFDADIVTLPDGLSFDQTRSYDGEFRTLTKSGNNFYNEDNNLELEIVNDSKYIVYEDGAVVDIIADNDYNFTAGASNSISIVHYYLKDAYVDIGDNVTKAMVEAAFDENDQNYSSAQSVAIRKAIGKLEQTVNVVLYGLRVNNTDGNSNLSGGVFQAYSDSNCTAGNEIGSSFTITNGVGSFVGISGDSPVYLKQVTAPSGYKLISEPIEVDPSNLTLGQDGYYEVNVVNQANALLPFTGGIGTIIYTCIGLLILAGSILFLITYRKKKEVQ